MIPAMVGERSEEGYVALTLESDARGGLVAVFVPEAGMICASLRHRGEELLGQRGGLRAYVDHYSTMGIPFLHPWANRLGAARFELAGRAVDLDLPDLPLKRDDAGLPIHGLLSAAPGWRVERHTEIERGGVLSASFDFAAYPHLLAAFPFPPPAACRACRARSGCGRRRFTNASCSTSGACRPGRASRRRSSRGRSAGGP